jgi:transcription initiation factor IIE alpha subunit
MSNIGKVHVLEHNVPPIIHWHCSACKAHLVIDTHDPKNARIKYPIEDGKHKPQISRIKYPIEDGKHKPQISCAKCNEVLSTDGVDVVHVTDQKEVEEWRERIKAQEVKHNQSKAGKSPG